MKFIFTICISILMATTVFGAGYTRMYLFGGTTTTYINQVDAAQGTIDTVSPDYFDIDPYGNLYMPKIDRYFIEEMHKRDIAVVPFISSHWDRELGIRAMENTEALTYQIAQAVKDFNLDGVDVNIENLPHTHRDAHTHFVRRLREKLPDKIITVAVAANPNGWTLGWHGSYDYAALANYCNYLFIMGYDQHYFGSAPGPVASSDFAKRSIEFALRYVQPDRLVLGVPFFGRFWQEGVEPSGHGVTMRDVNNLLKNFDAVETYHTDSQSAHVSLTIHEGDVSPTLWGGRRLSPGRYDIWYDNLQSLKYKLELAKTHNLKGTGAWALGQEVPEVWDVYAQFRQQTKPQEPLPQPPAEDIFIDIQDHWARHFINNVGRLGWMVGIGDNYFNPWGYLTRAQAVALVMNIYQNPQISEDYNMHFTDTYGHWAEDVILKARYFGIIEGKSEYIFAPNSPITRQDFIVILDKAFNVARAVDYYNNPFSDVARTPENYAFDAIVRFYENEIITGHPDGTFRPNDKILRAEAATICAKLYGFGLHELTGQDSFNDDRWVIYPR